MKEKLHRECYAISSRDMALGRAYVLGEDISRPSVCHALLFLRFLGYFKVGKHIFKCLVSYKQHLRPYKSPCWSVGLSVCLSRFAFFAFFRLF